MALTKFPHKVISNFLLYLILYYKKKLWNLVTKSKRILSCQNYFVSNPCKYQKSGVEESKSLLIDKLG